MPNVQLLCGDVRERLSELADNSIDSIVTDPPYELGFMGKSWDSSGIAYDVDMWKACLRVLKPGGHLLSFGGSRTYHRMACAVEDAGFEVRDQIMWLYGQGFPKSLDVSKAIDKSGGTDISKFKEFLVGAITHSGLTRKQIDEDCGFTMRFDTSYESDPIGWGVSLPSPEKWVVIARVLSLDATAWSGLLERVWRGRSGAEVSSNSSMAGANLQRADKGEAILTEAKQWDGWGTALKPAHEPIIVARKPLIGTVVKNVLEYGTGAINIRESRIGNEPIPSNKLESWSGFGEMKRPAYTQSINTGRWPANVIHDGSDDVMEEFAKYGITKSSGGKGLASQDFTSKNGIYGTFGKLQRANAGGLGDEGTAARFFYCAKANKKDRGEGNDHPTVKPTALMRYLVKLVTPPSGVVLDPFCGSGSTGKAAVQEGFGFVGIDESEHNISITENRLHAVHRDIVCELGTGVIR